MSQFNQTGFKAFAASAALAAATPNQFLRVKLTAGQLVLAGATDRDLGTLYKSTFNSGESVTVDLRTRQGTRQYIASGAIGVGADVFTDAGGKVSATQATGAWYLGTALEAAAANNDVIEVLAAAGVNLGAPGNLSFAAAPGTANVSLVTIQVKDSAGNNLAGVWNFDVWLSDAATGAGLTAVTASGAVAAGASGTDLGVYAASKAKRVQTDATGKYILSITDTAKTHFYVAGQINHLGAIVSAQLLTANYG